MLARHVEDRKSAKQYPRAFYPTLSHPFSPYPEPRRAGFFRVPFSHRSSGDVLVTDCARSGLWIYFDKWRLDIRRVTPG